MIDQIMMSLFTVLPIGGAAFALTKYGLNQLLIIKNENNKKSISITLLIKIIFSLLAGVYGAVAAISFFCAFWIPNFKIPQAFGIMMLLILAIFIISLPILFGWSKAVEAGASSSRVVYNEVKGMHRTKPQNGNPLEGEWKRKSEPEISKIKKQLKRSSYSPVMPIGVFIIVIATLYVFLRDTTNGGVLTVISSLVSFGITYLVQIVKGRSLVHMQRFKICNKCHRKDDIGLTKCFCGGIYEPQEYYISKEETNGI
jgi:hypothetical protein